MNNIENNAENNIKSKKAKIMVWLYYTFLFSMTLILILLPIINEYIFYNFGLEVGAVMFIMMMGGGIIILLYLLYDHIKSKLKNNNDDSSKENYKETLKFFGGILGYIIFALGIIYIILSY